MTPPSTKRWTALANDQMRVADAATGPIATRRRHKPSGHIQ
jgi:hypothetical protein